MARNMLTITGTSFLIEFFPSGLADYFLIHLPESINKGVFVISWFVGVEIHEEIDKIELYKFADLVTWITLFSPPCPSKTANNELPSPNSTS